MFNFPLIIFLQIKFTPCRKYFQELVKIISIASVAQSSCSFLVMLTTHDFCFARMQIRYQANKALPDLKKLVYTAVAQQQTIKIVFTLNSRPISEVAGKKKCCSKTRLNTLSKQHWQKIKQNNDVTNANAVSQDVALPVGQLIWFTS